MVHGTIRNHGGHHAGPFWVGFHISKNPKITNQDRLLLGAMAHVAGVPAGQSRPIKPDHNLRVPGDLPPGKYHIGILLDEVNAVKEKNEHNNHRSRPFTVLP